MAPIAGVQAISASAAMDLSSSTTMAAAGERVRPRRERMQISCGPRLRPVTLIGTIRPSAISRPTNAGDENHAQSVCGVIDLCRQAIAGAAGVGIELDCCGGLIQVGGAGEIPFGFLEGGGPDLYADTPPGDVVCRGVNAAPDARETGLVRGVALGGPLQGYIHAGAFFEYQKFILRGVEFAHPAGKIFVAGQ